jgi:hypothetical protein
VSPVRTGAPGHRYAEYLAMQGVETFLAAGDVGEPAEHSGLEEPLEAQAWPRGRIIARGQALKEFATACLDLFEQAVI